MNTTTFSAINLTHKQYNNTNVIMQRYLPAYKAWYSHKKQGSISQHDLQQSVKALNHAMPELMPTYKQLCESVDHDAVAQQFLTLHRPPAYLINCSQAVLTVNEHVSEPILLRNYDLSPDLSENLITHSRFNQHSIIGTNECIWGFNDGMNDAGLALSLTFGGRKQVGDGFGIPIILRYVLETCSSVAEAIVQLKRIPSHMSYNITLVDKSGRYATVLVAPDKPAWVLDEASTTNHQQQVEWQEQAQFSQTLARKNWLDKLLSQPDMNRETLLKQFLSKPLRSTHYAQAFGTVYTAEYRPASGKMSYHWPEQTWQHSFDSFAAQTQQEQIKRIQLDAEAKQATPPVINAQPNHAASIHLAAANALKQAFSAIPHHTNFNKQAFNALERLLDDEQASWQDFAKQMGQMGWQDSNYDATSQKTTLYPW